jgi:ACS family glucarate transporter-like MFS transporter
MRMPSELSSPPTVEKATGVRYRVLTLACTLSMITYLDRVCFGSVADYIKDEFGLSNTQKGMLFGAFALAYAAFEVPSGWLGDVYGPRRTLIRIVLWWSFFTALTGLIWPVAGMVPLMFAALVATRFLFGMGEAGAFPNIARAFHSWFPYTERGFAQGAVWMAGRFMGGATPLIVNSLIVKVVHDDGTTTVYWRHAFWIFGGIGILWCVVFTWWFRDRPEQRPEVNAAELALIRRGQVVGTGHSGVPWRRILGSANLWLLCAMYFCASYGWYLNITYLPGYLRSEGVTPETHGIWAGLMAGAPLLLGSCACLVGGLMTDAFIRRTGNRKWGRRLFGVIGHGACALCYFAGMMAPNVYVFVLFIALANFWNDITMGAAWASCLDIGRKYSGIVAGCMNTIGNLGGFVAGITTGLVLDLFRDPFPAHAVAATGVGAGARLYDHPQFTAFAWQLNFLSFAGAYLVAVVCWLFFDPTKALVNED